MKMHESVSFEQEYWITFQLEQIILSFQSLFPFIVS